VREGPQHLHRRVDNVLTDPAQPREYGEHQAEGRTDREPDQYALHRGQCCGAQCAVCGELSGAGRDLGRRGDGLLGEDAGA